MGMFLPEDILHRIKMFIAGKIEFPFVKRDEIMATFYMFGKEYKINGPVEVLTATDLAKRAIVQLSRDIQVRQNSPSKMNSDSIRQNYTNRALQISIELQNMDSFDPSDVNRRIVGDPTILSNCFVEHISYYKQDYFVELFQPFKKDQIPSSLIKKLEGRMLLLVFNLKNSTLLPFENTLIPFIRWIEKTSRTYDQTIN